MVSILGMASDRGHNLLALDRHQPGGASLELVVSDREGAPILETADERGIPTRLVEPVGGRQTHEERILAAVADADIDLVCLDGYDRILSDVFLEAMPTTLGVHPSLLPAFPGPEPCVDALREGVDVTGCTVHVVTDATDKTREVVESTIPSGPIVTQEPVIVNADDSVDDLRTRIRTQGEFRAYPRAVRWVATDQLSVTTTDTGEQSVTIEMESEQSLPQRRLLSDDRTATLRYGENPHQEAAIYRDDTTIEPSVVHGEQVSGDRDLSYVNYLDAAGALDLIVEFDRPAAAVIKHANPAGCATADDLVTAYERALSTDPMSAFGGVVSLNRPCDRETAEAIVDSVKHVVVAPGFESGVLDILGERESMRVLDLSDGSPGPIGPDDRTEPIVERQLVGGRLVQERDRHQLAVDDLDVVTDRAPTPAEVTTMQFAWRVVKHATSNAIALATDTETVGLGIGQVSRVDAVKLATRKAEEQAEGKGPTGAVMASDAFFPFPDGIETAAQSGVGAVIQPGGSMRDESVIDMANAHDMAMAFTGKRCFRHR